MQEKGEKKFPKRKNTNFFTVLMLIILMLLEKIKRRVWKLDTLWWFLEEGPCVVHLPRLLYPG